MMIKVAKVEAIVVVGVYRWPDREGRLGLRKTFGREASCPRLPAQTLPPTIFRNRFANLWCRVD